MRGDALRISRLEHESHGAGQLDRLQFRIAGVLERLAVRAMRQHAVVQADAAGRKPLRLGVVDAVDQPHEFRHDVHVIPRRTEGVLRHHPSLRENDEVDVRGARGLRGRRQHGENRRIGMIESDRTNRREGPQIVFVRRVVTVPCHDIDRGMRQSGYEQRAAPFHEQFGRRVLVLIGRDRGEEIARIGEAIGADRTALRQREGAAVILAQISARRTACDLDAEFHAARNHHDFAGFGIDPAEFGDETQGSLLRHEQHFTVGIVEMLIDHRFGDEKDVSSHASLRVDVSRRGHGLHALQEGHVLFRDRRRVPAQLRNRYFLLVAWCGAPELRIDPGEAAGMPHRRPDPIQPRAFIAAARRRERRAGQLFGVKPIGAALRRIASHRQRARQRFGLETVAEAGHIARRDIDGAAADNVGRGVDVHGDPPCRLAHISRSRSAVQITGSSIPDASSKARETLNGRQCS